VRPELFPDAKESLAKRSLDRIVVHRPLEHPDDRPASDLEPVDH
jgi:hypothetical protein